MCNHMPLRSNMVLQLDFLWEASLVWLTCSNVGGQQMLRVAMLGSDLLSAAHTRIAHELRVNLHSLQLILPAGELLSSAYHANALATLADATSESWHADSGIGFCRLCVFHDW